ncbi:MAG TPA: hypothetical protein VFG07_09025 [Thermoplasmata archaeon]|nr:hypothetical protein [Thermoplasmata archaeon]
MRSPTPWLVPVFLIALGLTLLWLGSVLRADGVTALALENSQRCSRVNSTNPHTCVTLASNTELNVAGIIGILGAGSTLAGLVVGLVRWGRSRHPIRSP